MAFTQAYAIAIKRQPIETLDSELTQQMMLRGWAPLETHANNSDHHVAKPSLESLLSSFSGGDEIEGDFDKQSKEFIFRHRRTKIETRDVGPVTALAKLWLELH